MTATLAGDVYRQALDAPLTEVAGLLQDVLTRRLTAYIVGVDNARTVSRWASGETTEIRDYEMERRLRTAYQIALLLLSQDAAATVRAWFIGLNPQLGDVSPAEALHNDQLKETLTAARAFVTGG